MGGNLGLWAVVLSAHRCPVVTEPHIVLEEAVPRFLHEAHRRHVRTQTTTVRGYEWWVSWKTVEFLLGGERPGEARKEVDFSKL